MSFDLRRAHDVSDSEIEGGIFDCGFDPDKLIEPKTISAAETSVCDESRLSGHEVVEAKVLGLDATAQETFELENGNTVFNTPEETGRHLNSAQGKAVEGFMGDCGLVSVENVARLAGKPVTEADVIRIAKEGGFCECDSAYPEENGGTTVGDMIEMLEALGIDSQLIIMPTKDELADAVESGRGTIAVVDTMELWENYPYNEKHAITVTSVERNADGDVEAFYVCDSGTGGPDYARRIDAETLERALSWNDPTIVTDKVIR